MQKRVRGEVKNHRASGEDMGSGIRHVGATLSAGEFAFVWVVKECCLCLGRHIHGGGPLNGDPRALLGVRVAHCRHQPQSHAGVYALVDVEPRRSAAVIMDSRRRAA